MSDSAATQDGAAIGKVLSSYEAALNASNTAAVMPLYADNGVFMAPNFQSAISRTALSHAYDAVFKAITLKVKFAIAEVVMISPQWAFVRTNSAGTQTVTATGAQSAEANQELFIVNKAATTDGESLVTASPPPIRSEARKRLLVPQEHGGL